MSVTPAIADFIAEAIALFLRTPAAFIAIAVVFAFIIAILWRLVMSPDSSDLFKANKSTSSSEPADDFEFQSKILSVTSAESLIDALASAFSINPKTLLR